MNIPLINNERANWRALPVGVIVALLTVYVVWGSTYLGIKVALQSFPPFLMTGARFAVAGGLLLLFLRLRGATLPNLIEWRNAAIIGGLLLAGGTGGTAFAEQWVASGLAAVAVATIPIWTAIFAGAFGAWPTRGEWIGLLVGFAGVGLLNLDGGLRANPIGAIALLIATMCWAFGSVVSQRLALPRGAMGFAAEMLAGGALLIVIGAARGEGLTGPIVPQAIGAWVYLVIFGSFAAFSAYMYLLNHVRPALATSYAYVNPAIALGLGSVFVGERITATSVLAMVVILAGVACVALARGRRVHSAS